MKVVNIGLKSRYAISNINLCVNKLQDQNKGGSSIYFRRRHMKIWGLRLLTKGGHQEKIKKFSVFLIVWVF